MQFKYSRVIAG